VNDVLIDPRNSQRVLLATDRSGVLASNDSAASFASSNHGYSHRYVTAILADTKEPNTLYIGLVNDREFGGVFSVTTADRAGNRKARGSTAAMLFTLKQAGNGTLVAGTNKGVFELAEGSSTWRPHQRRCAPRRCLAYRDLEERQEKDLNFRRQHARRAGRPRGTIPTWHRPLVRGNFLRTLHQQRSWKVWVGGAVEGGERLRLRASARRLGSRGDALKSSGFQDEGKVWQPAVLASYPLTFAA